MKRRAAILGPTPPHVRWSLGQPCPLRPISENDSPSAVFRQLRSLRELSIANFEGRVADGIAWAEISSDGNCPLGFVIMEVLSAYGGVERIEQLCTTCPANTLAQHGGWSGCFGTLVAPDWTDDDLTVERDRMDKGPLFGDSDWDRFQSLGGVPTSPRWYGLWRESPIPPPLLAFIGEALNRWLLRHAQSSTPLLEAQLMCNAIERAKRHSLSLHVSSFPPGHADGQYWTIPSHCSGCKAPRPVESTTCPVCGIQSPVVPQRRQRVLGLRPYLDLGSILGAEQAMARYQHWLKTRQSPC